MSMSLSRRGGDAVYWACKVLLLVPWGAADAILAVSAGLCRPMVALYLGILSMLITVSSMPRERLLTLILQQLE